MFAWEAREQGLQRALGLSRFSKLYYRQEGLCSGVSLITLKHNNQCFLFVIWSAVAYILRHLCSFEPVFYLYAPLRPDPSLHPDPCSTLAVLAHVAIKAIQEPQSLFVLLSPPPSSPLRWLKSKRPFLQLSSPLPPLPTTTRENRFIAPVTKRPLPQASTSTKESSSLRKLRSQTTFMIQICIA